MKHQKTIVYGIIGLALLALAWYYRDRLKRLPKQIGLGDVPTPPGATVDEEGNLVLPQSVTAPGSSETFFDLNTGPGQIALDQLTRELALDGLPGNVDLQNVFDGLQAFNAPNEDNAAEFEAVVFEGSTIEDFMNLAFQARFADKVEQARRIAQASPAWLAYPYTTDSRKVADEFAALTKVTIPGLWPSSVSGLPAPLIGRFASSTDRRPARWNDRMVGEGLSRYINMTAVFFANIQDEAKRLQNSARPQAIELLRARGWKFIQTDNPSNRTGR